MGKTIEQKYQEMDEVTHILSRPGMYVGSTKEEPKDIFVYNDTENKFEIRQLTFVPAMLKVVDEVISNSCDEYRRLDNLGLNTIEVFIDKNKGEIKIKDNGGIPVVIHKEAGIYVPEFIFGRLRTSSNYNDSESRNVIGTNGVGSSLSNIFSTKFVIHCADGKHELKRSWSNNMRTLNNDLTVTECSENRHFTETIMTLDLKKFGVTEISDDFIHIIRKRCIDAAAVNPGLTVKFWTNADNFPNTSNKDKWKFKNFLNYIELYSSYINLEDRIEFKNKLCHAYIFPDGAVDCGFVNGAECSKGTHMKVLRNEINTAAVECVTKKFKIKDITPRHIDGKYSIFMNITVANPSYDSQTKECLTTDVASFSKDPKVQWEVPKSFLNNICRSEIIELVKDWYEQKCQADNQKELRKLNKQAKKLFRSDKFIDCTSKKREERELWLFEGDSAKSGFRINRNPQIQCGYILRGVPKNCTNLTPVQVMKNEVFSDIVNILGLQWGEYNDASNLAFNRIIICSDMDYDGSKIAALLIVFFNHFPELFEQGLICRSISPIIVAKKNNDVKKYFSLADYKKDESSLKGYKIVYNKGLGGLDNTLYKEMLQDSIFQFFTKDSLSDSMLRKWFAKGIADERKDMIKEII